MTMEIIKTFPTLPGMTLYHQIAQEWTTCGLIWLLRNHDGKIVARSSGAFYDDCEDHPEGAVAWAELAIRRHEEKLLAFKAQHLDA